ncbi:ABC transporter permease [Anaeromyxobacter diazotrophicus]|uniref:Membrane protein n=1 Tax=Anaeromyxobacter diazotrophicus TaxID=2590199 RepID=A0A7I9VRW7_9BACT|nr:ABC transporter permease [Anaeromyxobacter diazotrophicus]GEJ59008.1 membrane protein [Anaeromyxobacter diazotrophicus]
MTERPRRFAVRVGAMAAKEVLHIQRDPRTLYLALVMPVVLVLLFGYGVSFDLDRIPLAVADADRSEASRALVDAFARANEFEVVREAGPEEVERLFRRGAAQAALVIRPRYGRDLARGDAGRAELLVDGADASTANQILQKADAIAAAESLRLAPRGGAAAVRPLEARTFTRYNPEARSALFLVPGLTAYLMAIGAVLLTALTVAGEWERGSMEQLFASPVGRFDIILGKLLPYLALGLVQLLLVVAVGATAFDVPIRGSLLLLFALGLVFLVGMLGQGLLISVLAKNQLVATQAGVLSSLLPSLLLSGALFPIENMPRLLQAISRVVPARYLVHGLRGVLLKGSGVGLVWQDLAAMALFAAAILALATARFQRRVA